VYFPSGASGNHRQDLKFMFLDYFYSYIQELKLTIPNLIICGDYNICNKSIDIHNPIANANSTGFLPEERAWMDKWFNNGFTDSFRAINGEIEHEYTWWSYRANARANNKGWRIDYISISDNIKNKLVTALHRPKAMHSDHCPLFAVLEI
jgi:exodeoxyribonuclease-3